MEKMSLSKREAEQGAPDKVNSAKCMTPASDK